MARYEKRQVGETSLSQKLEAEAEPKTLPKTSDQLAHIDNMDEEIPKL